MCGTQSTVDVPSYGRSRPVQDDALVAAGEPKPARHFWSIEFLDTPQRQYRPLRRGQPVHRRADERHELGRAGL